ncbi:unnamed protein product, partial [Laminaria digitata]
AEPAESSGRPFSPAGSSDAGAASDGGRAGGGEGEAAIDAAASPGRPRTTAPTPTTATTATTATTVATEAARASAAAVAAIGRRAFSRARVAVGKPRSSFVFVGPQRTAAEAAAVRTGEEGSPPADSSGPPPPDGPVPVPPKLVPPTLLMPPAAKALRERSRGGMFFPVRAPWRPPGYRWGVSLLSERRAQSGTPTPAKKGKGGAGTGGNEALTSAGRWPVPPAEEGDGEDSAALVDAPSRRMSVYNKVSGVAGDVLGRIIAAKERG